MENDSKKPQALDVEIVEDGQGSHAHGGRGQYYGRDGFTGFWALPPLDAGGCAAPAITFGLFMACLGQYGLLAAIGFFVFHVIGAVMGSVHQARQLMAGLPCNPWAWRVGNWIISFLLTMWLAGGFNE